MRMGKCQTCGREDRLVSLFYINHGLYCETCGNTLVAQLKQQNAPLEITRPVDASICAVCSDDAGSADFPITGKLPLCPKCQEKVHNRTYPVWLKASFALTLVLLAVALVHGGKYFHAGRQLFRGERLLSAKHYADAAAPLRDTLAVAPDCVKCRLLLAKAALLSGNPDEAFELVKDRKFESSDEFTDVKPDFERADRASGLLGEAARLYKTKSVDAAIAKLHEASQAYPEWPLPGIAEHSIRIGDAFDHKDYDAFLQMTQADWDQRQNFDTAAGLSAALACKYAASGAEEYRQHAEEIFAQAAKLATTPDEKASLDEFADRFHHRLTSREIIDKQEYDRRFRKKPADTTAALTTGATNDSSTKKGK